MQIKIKKILCLILSIVVFVPLCTGCFSEGEVVEVVGEQQMMKDEYIPNSQITNYIPYWVDYVINLGVDDIEVATMYDFFDIQVDDWDCVTIGVTTMKELVSAIERSNRNYIMRKTAEIIETRQDEIDREYAQNAKEAEKDGKEYTKKKKLVRIDDIAIASPYAYTIKFGEGEEAEPVEYQPTLLVDPSTYNMLYLDVTKYGIPYVRFEFANNEIVNSRITQEADWVVNGAQAASLAGTVYLEGSEEDGYSTAYDFVDVDGRNKAAKKNVRMSGNVALGGEGFTWDSLMKLCQALQLEDYAEDYVDENYFHQTSDANFTYYTLMLNTNPFAANPKLPKIGEIDYQITRLIATFDPLSQVCVNWALDTYTETGYVNGDEHKLNNPKRVNVHEYQVDTRDYVGMRNTISAWIDANALPTVTAYCAFDSKDKLFGVVDSGITNVTLSPIINGVEYDCLDYDIDGDIITGKYISVADHDAALMCETEEEINKFIDEKTVTLKIGCYIIYDGNKVVSAFNENIKDIFWDETSYFVASYAGDSGSGYRNVRLLDETGATQLMVLYLQTYELDDSQYDQLKVVKEEKGLIAIGQTVNQWFKEAEEDQKRQNITGGYINAKDLAAFKFNEDEYTMNVLFEDDLAYSSFEKDESISPYDDDLINLSGHNYTMTDDWGLEEGEIAETYQVFASTTSSGVVYFLCVDDDSFVFYKDIKTGMSKYDVIEKIGPSAQVIEGAINDYIIAESGDIKMTVIVDHVTGQVEKICMTHNLFYDEIHNY
jgi:hypothetical protein